MDKIILREYTHGFKFSGTTLAIIAYINKNNNAVDYLSLQENKSIEKIYEETKRKIKNRISDF